MVLLQFIVTSVRGTLADSNVDPKHVTEAALYATGRAHNVALQNAAAIARLTRVKFELRNESYNGADVHFWLPEPKVDREKVAKEIAELEKVIANSERQLSNEAFIAKAPEKIVAGMRQKQAEYEAQLAKLRAAL